MTDILNDQYSHLRNQAAAYVGTAKEAANVIEEIHFDLFPRGTEQDVEALEVLITQVSSLQRELASWAARINERALSVAYFLGKRDT